MENGVPTNHFGGPQSPHPGVSGGGGDGERSHGSKLKYNMDMLSIAAYSGDRSEVLAGNVPAEGPAACQLKHSQERFPA